MNELWRLLFGFASAIAARSNFSLHLLSYHGEQFCCITSWAHSAFPLLPFHPFGLWPAGTFCLAYPGTGDWIFLAEELLLHSQASSGWAWYIYPCKCGGGSLSAGRLLTFPSVLSYSKCSIFHMNIEIQGTSEGEGKRERRTCISGWSLTRTRMLIQDICFEKTLMLLGLLDCGENGNFFHT